MIVCCTLYTDMLMSVRWVWDDWGTIYRFFQGSKIQQKSSGWGVLLELLITSWRWFQHVQNHLNLQNQEFECSNPSRAK